MDTLSNNSYTILRDKADEILKNNCKDEKEFKQFKKWIFNEIIDPFNLKLPSKIIIEYYNYCINNLKK